MVIQDVSLSFKNNLPRKAPENYKGKGLLRSNKNQEKSYFKLELKVATENNNSDVKWHYAETNRSVEYEDHSHIATTNSRNRKLDLVNFKNTELSKYESKRSKRNPLWSKVANAYSLQTHSSSNDDNTDILIDTGSVNLTSHPVK